MDSTTSNVPDTIREQARQRALVVLNSDPNCISYVRPEDLETQSLFIPVVSVIKPMVEDFHPAIPGIGILPKVQLQNLIREKSGTNIIRTDDGKRGEYIWTAHAYGERRMPDGTMEKDDGVYEFDAEKRAEEDFLKQPDKYNSELLKRKHVLELCRFAQSKAVTGAQWIVTKKLAKVAASFKTPQELMRGMKVVRYDRNVNGMMADPAMHQAIMQHALGATETIYGPSKQLESQPIARTYDESGEREEPAAQDEKDQLAFPEETPAVEEPELSPVDKLKEILRGYLPKIPATLAAGSGKTIHSLIQAVVEKKTATEKDINPMIDWCEQYVQNTRVGNGGAA